MKINSVSVYSPRYYQRKVTPAVSRTNAGKSRLAPYFKGKYDCALFLGGVGGALGTLGAIGGMLIMTGGLGAATLPFIAGYGAFCTGTGAVLGNMVDKGARENEDKQDKTK